MLNDAGNTEEIETQTPDSPDLGEPAGEPSGGAQPASDSTTSAPPPEPSGSDHIPRSRFNEVIAERNRERAEKAQLLAALQAGRQPEASKPVQPQAPKQEDYATYEDYIDARSEFKAEAAANARWEKLQQEQQQIQRNQEQQTREQSIESNWSQKTTEARAKYSDFDEKLSNAPRLHPIAQQVLRNAQNAGDLGYHLASNPDLIAKVNGMHPLDMAAELGRIEGKLSGVAPQPPKVSQMPKPMAPIGGNKSNKGNEGSGAARALEILYPT